MMPYLCNIDGKKLIKFIEYHGYKFIRQKGSHKRYKNSEGVAITIPVSGKKVVKQGLLHGLLKDMKLNQTNKYGLLADFR